MDPVSYMLLGATALANVVAGVFFLRFWKGSRDRFFLLFAASFLIEGLNRIFMGLACTLNEDVPAHYLVRLLSYALIVIAVLDKNRLPQERRSKSDMSRTGNL